MAGNNGNNGADHRRTARRTRKDRRELVRWEPLKSERRTGHGRRSNDSPGPR